MKRALLILVMAFLVLQAWLLIPMQTTNAQVNPYGPNVKSKLLRFNVVCATNGANEVIAAKAATKYRIISFAIKSRAGVVSWALYNGDHYMWASAVAPDPIDLDGVSGPCGMVWDEQMGGWFESDTVNEAVNVSLNAAESVIVAGTYVEIN